MLSFEMILSSLDDAIFVVSEGHTKLIFCFTDLAGLYSSFLEIKLIV